MEFGIVATVHERVLPVMELYDLVGVVDNTVAYGLPLNDLSPTACR
jgi:hypothetical protein